MQASEDTGVIYSLTCRTTGKSYIGQAKDFKHKDGIPYRYGLQGRWNDHISVNNGTPIHQDIVQYGADDFIVRELLRRPLNTLDAIEAETIAFNNTLTPNGYNVMKHSRVKNREESNVGDFYVKTAISVEVTPIKRGGENAIVYVYVQDVDLTKDRTRFVFGQGGDSTYDEAVEEAMEFIEPFQEKGIHITIHPEILGIEDPLSRYHAKLSAFHGKDVTKVIMTRQKWPTFSTVVVRIFVGKEKTQLSFGGKTIDFSDAYDTAKLFIKRIKNQKTQIEETEILQEFLKVRNR